MNFIILLPRNKPHISPDPPLRIRQQSFRVLILPIHDLEEAFQFVEECFNLEQQISEFVKCDEVGDGVAWLGR